FEKDVRAVIGQNVRAAVGGSVTVEAIASESFTMLAAGAAATPGTAGVTGSFVVLLINQIGDGGTRALIEGGQANPSIVEAGGDVTLTAQNNVLDSLLFAGGVAAGGTAGVGVSSIVLVRTGKVDAGIAAYD